MSEAPIGLSRPDITEQEIQAVADVMRSGRLSIGPRLEAFEQAVARRAGREYGIGVSSGTAGLHLCVKALDIGPGDEVITTPFTFIASTNCILFEGARPVFVDIDPVSWNLDPAAAAQAVTPATKALLPVEVFGNTAHFDAYEALAADRGLAMIEDCCEALGGTLGDRPAGSFGDGGVFAFYPNKQITTGEGGVIVTDSAEMRQLCVSLRNQGRDSAAWLSHGRLGYNYRLSEIAAAIGEVQMRRLDEILQRRREVAALYAQALAHLEGVHLPPCPADDPARASWFVYVIRLADAYDEPARNRVLEHLQGAGIGCRAYFAPLHLQPYLRETLGYGPGEFPNCEALAERTIALPFHAGLSEADVARIAETLAEALDRTR
jgi:perosamine synthetase